MDLANLTIKSAQELLQSGKVSAVELCEYYLGRIKKMDKEIHAFLLVDEEKVLDSARLADKKIKDGTAADFEGIPIALKDNIATEGTRTTAASKILENYVPVEDATAVVNLKKAGFIILGKTNLDEFAMGSSTENSAFGPTRNPLDLTRVPGGSSGGSAAAVAADFCVAAVGSETGGSIRQPAAFCGAVGLKTTYGKISRSGLFAFGSSLDQIGPLTKNVEDCEILTSVLAGEEKDPLDSTHISGKSGKSGSSGKKYKIGVPKEYFTEGIEAEVEKIVREAIAKLKKAGHEIIEISLPHTKYSLPIYYVVAVAEASSNLLRYDGIKYGFSLGTRHSLPPGISARRAGGETPSGPDGPLGRRRNSKLETLYDVYAKSRGEGFGAEVKRRIMLGTYALSAGYYDAYYLKAMQVRTLVKKDFDEAFKKVDLIVAPTTPTVAFKFGEKTDNPLSMYLSDIYTVPANIAGIAAISVPCGLSENLPVGLQIIGPQWSESEIFNLAKQVE